MLHMQLSSHSQTSKFLATNASHVILLPDVPGVLLACSSVDAFPFLLSALMLRTKLTMSKFRTGNRMRKRQKKIGRNETIQRI